MQGSTQPGTSSAGTLPAVRRASRPPRREQEVPRQLQDNSRSREAMDFDDAIDPHTQWKRKIRRSLATDPTSVNSADLESRQQT